MMHGDCCKVRSTVEDDTRAHCGQCGHTWPLHPGRMNPTLGYCLVCALERMIDDGH